MRFLILDSYYPEPIRLAYDRQPGLEERPWTEQLAAIYALGFARADFLPRHLQQLGHEATQLIINAEAVQRQWARAHGLRLPRTNWLARVVEAQVEAIDPDLLFNCDLLQLPAPTLRRLRGRRRRLLIGECAYPVPPTLRVDGYDLLVSSAPHYVARFQAAGLRAALWRHAFEPAVLDALGPEPLRTGVVFIGSIGTHHRRRTALLETLSRQVPLQCYGRGAEELAPDSPLRRCLKPPVWGYEMYRQLRQAQVAVNLHVDAAEEFAGNMRMFEITGVGTLLVTDWKRNLEELFEPGQEVVAYRTSEECVEQVQHYLAHEEARQTVAAAGQRRTLRDHTYAHRVQELIELITRDG